MIHRILSPVGQFFASLRLTIFLLVALAGAMSLGTIYEAEQGTPAARVVFYRAWWFDFLLVLLAGNIIGCTYLRRPKRTTRWAYLLMHQAIIVIFAGGLIGRWWGTEGQLVFAEGQTRSSMLADRNVLKVKFANHEYKLQTDVVDAFPRIQRPDHTFYLDKHGIKLRVKTFYPDHDFEPGAIPGDAGDPSAIHLEFTQGRQKARQWMFTGKQANAVSFGGLPVNVREGGVIDPQAALPPVGGVLELIGEGNSFQHLLPIEGSLRKPMTLEGTPWTITILEAYRRFTMHEGKPVDRPHGEDNPAVIFRLEGPGGTENRVAFSQYPDFDSEHGRATSKVIAKYHFHAHALEIFADAAKRALTGRYTDVDKVTVGPLVPGTQKYPVGPDGLAFKVLAFLPHARRAMVPINKSNQVKQPAMEVSIENLVGEVSTWLVFDEPKEVAFGDSVATFTYTKEEFPLGFDLTLKKFHVGRYEGTNNPASFESTVDLDDSSRALKDQEQVISMNRPLVHNGYTCYQSSYVEGPRMVSILSIAHDPGGLLAYIGFIGFMIGLVCVITFRQNRPGKSATGGKQ